MRLTLRTMLAYLDKVLEPNEAEELGRKIQESDFAAGLVQRIRTVNNKVRMDAPSLDGKGMGNDANTVAEYLDSALPQDRVGDFERVCLESHKHLAEVAGCHQILTLVLGKPADVLEILRDRVYALGHTEKPALASVTAPSHDGSAGPAVKTRSKSRATRAARPAAEVPDYLRSGRPASFWQFAGTLAAVFLLTALALRLMGPFNRSHPVLTLLGGGEPGANVADAGSGSSQAPGSADNNSSTGTTVIAPLPARDGDAKSAKASDSRPRVDKAPLEARVVPAPAKPDAVTSAENIAADRVAAEKVAAEKVAAEKIAAETTPKPAPDAEAPAAPEPALPAEPMPRPLPLAPVPPPPMPDPAAVGMEVGRYLSDEQVLAHQLEGEGIWIRMPSRAVLVAGERLVALPAFRPQIALASGVQVTMAGESSVRLGAPTEAGASTMSVDYGRLLMVTVGAAGAQVELDLGGVRGVATLVDADSAVAVSVKRLLPPGVDPESMPPLIVVEIFNTFGRVTWKEEGKAAAEIPSNQVRIYMGDEPAEDYGPFVAPEWIDARSALPIERESQVVLERMLAVDRPLDLTLVEALSHRQVNVRSLAARCLAAIGEFEPLVKELTDPRQYAYWSAGFVTLRLSVQRGPETAVKLRTALERVRPDQAEELYRLLWGFSADQLAEGGAVTLVKQLESEQMDVRVLAIQNLMAITGAMEFYRPEKKPEDTRAAVQAWKSRLARNKITFTTAPAAIEPYKPLDRPPSAAAELSAPKGAVAPLPPLPMDRP